MATALTIHTDTQALALAATAPQRVFVEKLMPYLPQLAAAIPKARAVEFYLTLTLRLSVEQPKVLACTPESVIACLVDVARWRLEIGRTVHLIPREVKEGGRVVRTDLTTIIDYKGHVQLMMRAGALDAFAEVVYESDAFEYDRARRRVTHHVRGKGPRTPAAVAGAYAVVVLRGGVEKAEYLERDEIEARRARSSRPNGELWSDRNYAEACKKSAMRAVQKWVPQDADPARHYDDPNEFQEPTPTAMLVGTGQDVYGEDAMGPRPSRALAAAESATVLDISAMIEQEGDGVVTSDGEPVDYAPHVVAGPPACPECGGEMWDNRATKTNPRSPDFKCKAAPRTRGGPGCAGIIWPAREG